MKTCFQGVILFLNLLLAPYCFGMDTFENQLNELLSGKLKYSIKEYSAFTTEYEASIIEYIQNGTIKLNQPIVTEHPHNAPYVQYFVHFIAETGNSNILKTIIDIDPSMLELRNSSGETPLMLACNYTNVSCVAYLFEQDADPMNMFLDRKKYWTAIHPMFYIINIADSGNQSVEDIKRILWLIIRKCPQFLTYEYKNQNCLDCVEELIAVKKWTCYPDNDPEEIRVKKEKLEYLSQIKKFIEAKMKLRRFSRKEDTTVRNHKRSHTYNK
jgi:hypothetical protein